MFSKSAEGMMKVRNKLAQLKASIELARREFEELNIKGVQPTKPYYRMNEKY